MSGSGHICGGDAFSCPAGQRARANPGVVATRAGPTQFHDHHERDDDDNEQKVARLQMSDHNWAAAGT
jgi:hypothetical protein